MAEPIKIKFEYQNPDNVQSDVPGEQKIREVKNGDETKKTLVRRNNSYSGGQTPAIDQRRLAGRRHSNTSNASSEGTDKSDGKKTRTKIPVSRFRQSVEKVKTERRASKDIRDQESHIPIRRSSIPKATKTPTKPTRKPPSVPKTEAKTITDAVIKTNDDDSITKSEETESIIKIEAKKTNKDDSIQANSEENESIVKIEAITDEAAEEEFDKLYEEVVHSPTPIIIDESLLNPNVDDPEKLESKFKEIIHDYDENRVQPIDVEKIKKSKIPFLKRKSQQEIVVGGDRSGKMIAARDKLRMRRSSAKADEVIDGKADKANNIDTKAFTRNVNQVKADSEVNTLKENDSKVEEESNDKIDDNQFEIQNDEIDAEIDNVFAEIEIKFDVHNDVDDKIPDTIENTNYDINMHEQRSELNIEKLEEDKSTDINEVKVAIDEFNDLKATDNNNSEETDTNPSSEDLEKAADDSELNEIKEDITSDNAVDTDNVIIENIADEKVPDNITPTEITRDIKVESIGQLEEVNICKGYIQIGIPVFEAHVHEVKEERDPEVEKEDIYFTHIEDKHYDTANTELVSETVEVKTNSNVIEIADTNEEGMRIQDEIEDTKVLMKEKDGSVDDVAKLRGKVGKLIERIDSHEPVETHKVSYGNDLPKKKSVLSKIAMFERQDAVPVFKTKIPKNETKLSKLDFNKQANDVHIHTPLIVDEVFKPFEAKTVLNTNVNSADIPAHDNDTEIVKAEMVIIDSLEYEHYNPNNKIENNTNDLPNSKICEEVLPPVFRDYEPKSEENKDENKLLLNNGNVQVVVPKFTPVKEVLKRYETINNSHVKKIEIRPKTKPISEIIKTLKPEPKTRSLDAMFTQSRPVTDILKDLKPENTLPIEVTKEVDSKQDLKNYEDIEKVPNFIEVTRENGENYDPKPNSNKDITRHGRKSYKSLDKQYKTLQSIDDNFKTLEYIQDYHNTKMRTEELRKAKSVAELDLGDYVRGKVNKLVDRMNSIDKIVKTKEVAINQKEFPRQRSVLEKIALFEPPRFCLNVFFEQYLWQESVCLSEKEIRKITPMKTEAPQCLRPSTPTPQELPELQARIQELASAREKYNVTSVPKITLANGKEIPAIALGTALLDPRLVFHVVSAAIELGYRAIDTAYIYGNERAVGEAIRAKINDGTVTRGDLFIMSKLWSTFHRRDLVLAACEASLEALGLEYIDLFMIHNPMSFKEGGDPIPKIATVLQYSEHDYMDAWYGMEELGDRVRSLGLSNFNAAQVQRVIDRARIKPVVNQVECHPYLSQQRLDDFCRDRNITLSCFGVLGSKGTPQEFKSGQPPAIDDPLIQVMASGLNVSPAQLLIRYQLQYGRQVVVKASSAANLWNNLQSVNFSLTDAQMDAIRSLNRNKRNFIFRGMGDTHKNYPFKELF